MSRKALFIPDLIPPCIALARDAGSVIMRYYKAGGAVTRKEDASPVTEADREADRLIVAGLKTLAPYPVVSEEGEQTDVSQAEYFWLVDPLDGTKGFVRGSGHFTVNIALIDAARTPVLGIIYDPVNKNMYWGSDEKAFREHEGKTEIIRCRAAPKSPVAIISHAHINEATKAYLDAEGVHERMPCSSSIKFCMIAEGNADIYPRFGPTSEWDTAAGHAILVAAGGSMTTPDGTPFLYAKPKFLNGNFIAKGC